MGAVSTARGGLPSRRRRLRRQATGGSIRPMLCNALLLLLAGCPESPTGGATVDAAQNNTPQGDQAGGEPIDGSVEPPPTGEGSGGGGKPSSDSFAVVDGKGVTLSGEAVYPGEQSGTWRLVVLDLPNEGAPGLLLSQSIPKSGEFSFTAPKGYGEIHLVAFVDLDGDGPTGTDPAGTVAVEVSGDDIDGLSITIADEPDLGELTPNMPGPHSGAGDPPPEGEPQEGKQPSPDPDAAPPPLGDGADVTEEPPPLGHGADVAEEPPFPPDDPGGDPVPDSEVTPPGGEATE